MRKVHIIRGNFEYDALFRERGWEIVPDIEDADLVCFTGGEDVDPQLYGHARHRTTYPSMLRDMDEKRSFRECMRLKIPMVGICRGAQFLNVMCGGEMYQDVSKHARAGTHKITDQLDGDVLDVTSTHHQMMKPGKDALIIATASEGGIRTYWSVESNAFVVEDSDQDYEVVLYEECSCLCFQPHPEFRNGEFTDMKNYFFKCIDMYLF